MPLQPVPSPTSNLREIYKGIGAVLLSLIPVLCVIGIILGIFTLNRATARKDKLCQILSIVAIIIGALMTLQTCLVIFFMFSVREQVSGFHNEYGFLHRPMMEHLTSRVAGS